MNSTFRLGKTNRKSDFFSALKCGSCDVERASNDEFSVECLF